MIFHPCWKWVTLLLLFMAFFMAMFRLLGRWRRITLFTMCKRLTDFRAPRTITAQMTFLLCLFAALCATHHSDTHCSKKGWFVQLISLVVKIYTHGCQYVLVKIKQLYFLPFWSKQIRVIRTYKDIKTGPDQVLTLLLVDLNFG